MSNLDTLEADLHCLCETIDREASLEEIRIATLRALTRHRFFSEEVLRETGDWEPRLAMEEWQRAHDEFRARESAEILRLSEETDGMKKVGDFLRTNVPPLPEEIRDRASQPLGQFLKHIVHRIAAVCLRDRDDEAAAYWQQQTTQFESEASRRDDARDFLAKIPRERHAKVIKKTLDLMQEKLEKSEPGDDWVDTEEIVGSDAAFEINRQRILRSSCHELELYLQLLDRRLRTGGSFSGLYMINDQEVIAWPQEKPDWERDEQRDVLITALQKITGLSFE